MNMQDYRIRLTDKAIEDINSIDYYISIDLMSPYAAKKVVERIRSSIEKLSTMPERFRRIETPDSPNSNIRIYSLESILIIYEVDKFRNEVNILRVVNSKIDYKRLF